MCLHFLMVSERLVAFPVTSKYTQLHRGPFLLVYQAFYILVTQKQLRPILFEKTLAFWK